MNPESVPPGMLFPKLLCDIMIPPQFSAAVRSQRYAVVEVRTLPMEIQRDDRAILQEAARHKRAVITCNYSLRHSGAMTRICSPSLTHCSVRENRLARANVIYHLSVKPVI